MSTDLLLFLSHNINCNLQFHKVKFETSFNLGGHKISIFVSTNIRDSKYDTVLVTKYRICFSLGVFIIQDGLSKTKLPALRAYSIFEKIVETRKFY